MQLLTTPPEHLSEHSPSSRLPHERSSSPCLRPHWRSQEIWKHNTPHTPSTHKTNQTTPRLNSKTLYDNPTPQRSCWSVLPLVRGVPKVSEPARPLVISALEREVPRGVEAIRFSPVRSLTSVADRGFPRSDPSLPPFFPSSSRPAEVPRSRTLTRAPVPPAPADWLGLPAARWRHAARGGAAGSGGGAGGRCERWPGRGARGWRLAQDGGLELRVAGALFLSKGREAQGHPRLAPCPFTCCFA